MTKLKIFILSLTGVVVTIVIILFAGIAYIAKVMHDSPLCGEDVVRISESTGDYVATSYLRGCGATTGFVAHVNLSKKGEKTEPNYIGLIEQGKILEIEGDPEIIMTWQSPTKLELKVVGYDPKNIFYSHSYGPIHIQVK